MDIVLFALILAIGMVLGRKGWAPRWLIERSDKVLSMVIYALIFLIGIEIGSYREILSNLGSIGIRSITITVLSMSLSAYMTKLLIKGRDKA